MSYEQKYLKYKQKYQELKRQLGGGAHRLETDDEFILTDTPSMNQNINQNGGNFNSENDFELTDTPSYKSHQSYQSYQSGGSILAPAPIVAPVAPMPCTGVVNPMPVVNLPVIPPAPVVSNKNYTHVDEELNSTTDLSEIQNTEDIINLFNQHGNGRKPGRKNVQSEQSEQSERSGRSGRSGRKSSRDSSSSSSSLSSSSLSSSDSLSELDSDSD